MTRQENFKKIIFDLILEHKIKVISWRRDNSGYAYFESWEVAIPKPISLAKFMTCCHEIGHLVKDKMSNPTWYSEYVATKYAIDTCRLHNIPIPDRDLKANQNYLTHCIAEEIQNGVDFNKIPLHVLEYANIDAKLWKRKIRQKMVPEVTARVTGWFSIKTTWIKKKVS